MNRLPRIAALLLLLAVCACAPLVQSPGRPGSAFAGPALGVDTWTSSDGTALPLKVWRPEGDQPWAVIVALHGINSHAGAFRQAGPYWAERGVATYAYDQRGFGASPRRGVWGGDELLEEDLRTLTRLVRARYPNAVIAVAGCSLGGAIAIRTFASDDPPPADRLLLFSPAAWDRDLQPKAARMGLSVTARLARGVPLPMLGWLAGRHPASDNAEEMADAAHDPLVIWKPRPDATDRAMRLMDHAADEIGELAVPTAYFYGAHDNVVPKAAAIRAAGRAPAATRTAYYADGWHWLLLDRQAPKVMDDALAFLRDPAAPLPSGAPPIPKLVAEGRAP